MAKTPVAKPNVVVVQGRAPFMPAVFVQQTPANSGSSIAHTPTPYVGPREDACHDYLNYDAVSIVRYNGQSQTSRINQTFKP